MKVGFDNKIGNKLKLHHATYYNVRASHPDVPSSLVQTARDCASEMLKREKFKVLPVKRKYSAIRYNARTFSAHLGKGFVTLATLGRRYKMSIKLPKCYTKYIDWKIRAATLKYDERSKRLVISMIVEQTTPSLRPPTTMLGVDTGILNHAVLSNNKFYSSSQIRSVKGRYQHLRAELQAKGTRSAKRKLKKIGNREQRFMRDVNRQVAKWIVNQPFDAIAIENLSVVRTKSLGKKFNRMLGKWAFGQLQSFIKERAEEQGKQIFEIDARYTSQGCSKCGRIHKSNRKRHDYTCDKCGFHIHADLNASRNIASRGISMAGRLSVNQPNVASEKSVSYKPRALVRGH